MATTLRREGGCWENRFVPPSAAELVEGVTRSLRPSVSLVRKSLVAAGDVHERVQWQGVWKWTLVYEHAALLGRAWAFLVLEPGRPRLCIPMPEEALTDLLVRCFSREV